MAKKGEKILLSICVIEDDVEIRNQLAEFLGNNGYECQVVTEFTDVPEQILRLGADLVLLDLTLPGADGQNILRQLRKESDVPVIIVTSKNTEMDEVICMTYGADDFITKPYNPALLLLHIEAVTKRMSRSGSVGGGEQVLSHGELSLDMSRGSLSIGGEEVELTKNEMRILAYLMGKAGQIVSRDELMGHLWDSEEFVDDNTLTVNINRVRTKLKEYGVEDAIVTKRGIGYLLK